MPAECRHLIHPAYGAFDQRCPDSIEHVEVCPGELCQRWSNLWAPILLAHKDLEVLVVGDSHVAADRVGRCKRGAFSTSMLLLRVAVQPNAVSIVS